MKIIGEIITGRLKYSHIPRYMLFPNSQVLTIKELRKLSWPKVQNRERAKKLSFSQGKSSSFLRGHWCFKRKYLQGKRGIEKPPFDLPEFIKKTGIMEMREALAEKEQEKGLKSKMREKKAVSKAKAKDKALRLRHSLKFAKARSTSSTLSGLTMMSDGRVSLDTREAKSGVDFAVALASCAALDASARATLTLLARRGRGEAASQTSLTADHMAVLNKLRRMPDNRQCGSCNYEPQHGRI